MKWDLASAVALCIKIEAIAPKHGCHVALTGGCLYKDGQRKDLDVLFYRVRQVPIINQKALFAELEATLGMTPITGKLWCYKTTHEGKNIDMFFPEEAKGDANPPSIGYD